MTTLTWKKLKYLSTACAVGMALILCVHLTRSAEYVPGESGIVPAGQTKDVFINADTDMLAALGVTSEKLSGDLKQYIIDNSAGEFNDANLRLRYNVATVNTRDLSDWYVFDHYDNGLAANSTYGITSYDATAANTDYRPYDPGDAMFKTGRRPYYSFREGYSYTTRSGGTPYTPFSNVYSIPQLLELGAGAGMVPGTLTGNSYGTDSTQKHGNARKLKSHISSIPNQANPSATDMIFMGYGGRFNTSNSLESNRHYLTDFLFYPSDSQKKKTVEFDINSADVRTHSMVGAGFLINTGMRQASEVSYIEGYALYITFSAANGDVPPNGAAIKLYKIKNDIKADVFHDRGGVASTNLAPNYMTLIASSTADNNTAVFGSGAAFKSTLHLQVVFDDDSLVIHTSPYKGSADVTDVVFDTPSAVSGTEVLATGHYGFGPLVDYTGASHNCNTTSAYKFTNLEMYFEVSVFDSLLKTQFYTAQNVDRFFLNLVSTPVDESNSDFWEGVARLRSDKVYYVTNGENTVVGPEGANLGNGLNLTWPMTYGDLIQALGDYILQTATSGWDEGLPELGSPVPVAGFDALGVDAYTPSGIVLDRIEQQMLRDVPVAVFINNKSTVAGDTIETLNVTWTGPDGFSGAKTINVGTDGYDLFDLTEFSKVGLYDITVVAVSTGGSSSAPLTRSFEIVRDATPPVASLAASEAGNVKNGVFRGTSAEIELSDVGWGVKAYQVLFGDDQGPYTASGNAPVNEFSDLWASCSVSVPDLKQPASHMYVTVWDWVGNHSTLVVPIAPYSVTFSPDNVFGFDLAAHAFPTDYEGNFYQFGETVAAAGDSYTTPNGKYILAGFSSSVNGAVLTDFEITGDVTLYPIFEYIGAPVNVDLIYDSGEPVSEIGIDVIVDEESDVSYIVLPYDPNVTPGNPSDSDIEEMAGGGWQPHDPSVPIRVGPDELASGEYIVVVKVTDKDGNVSYKITDPFEYVSNGAGQETATPGNRPGAGVPTGEPGAGIPTGEPGTGALTGGTDPNNPGNQTPDSGNPGPNWPVTVSRPQNTQVTPVFPSVITAPEGPARPEAPGAPGTGAAESAVGPEDGAAAVNSGVSAKTTDLRQTGVGAETTGLDRIINRPDILTAEDRAVLEKGGSVSFELTLDNARLSGAEADKVAAFTGAENLRLVDVIDLEFIKSAFSADGEKLYSENEGDLGGTVLVNLPLSPERQSMTGLKLYKLVDGELVYVPNLDESGLTYSFEADKLGIYILCEEDVPLGAGFGAEAGAGKNNPRTGDAGGYAVWFILIS